MGLLLHIVTISYIEKHFSLSDDGFVAAKVWKMKLREALEVDMDVDVDLDNVGNTKGQSKKKQQ